jgi:hypothetical protein
VILLVLYRLVRYSGGQIFGHVIHGLMLGAFAWDVVMGLAALVGIGFWIFGAIRGPQLDRGAA